MSLDRVIGTHRRFTGSGAPDSANRSQHPDGGLAGCRQVDAGRAQRRRPSPRGYTRALRVGRTIADLAGAAEVGRMRMAEALAYRRRMPGRRVADAGGAANQDTVPGGTWR
ncbi:MAG: hypothetical protein P4L71_10580 [Acetobacteraceae bacterium]|nr:hypothetical protein [Acetobacteraceae bacterium]